MGLPYWRKFAGRFTGQKVELPHGCQGRQAYALVYEKKKSIAKSRINPGCLDPTHCTSKKLKQKVSPSFLQEVGSGLSGQWHLSAGWFNQETGNSWLTRPCWGYCKICKTSDPAETGSAQRLPSGDRTHQASPGRVVIAWMGHGSVYPSSHQGKKTETHPPSSPPGVWQATAVKWC